MDKRRWEKVNTFEMKWWARWKRSADIKAMREMLASKADRIDAILKKYSGGAPEGRRVLQIGPAATGEVHFMSGERYAIDPLAPFFIEQFPDLIDPKVQFIRGMGENVPYGADFFDVVLILNVLDHCFDPQEVLAEISRCIKKDGVLIVDLYLYGPIGSFLHRLFGFVDREHPHAITHGWLMKSIKGQYEVLEETFAPIGEPRHDPIKRGILAVLRLLGLAPTNYRLFSRKLR